MPFLTVPQLLLRAAERFGPAPAVVTRDGEETFAELARRTAASAGALRRLGMGTGDRLLLVAGNGLDTLHAWLGAIHAGVVPAAVNPALTPPELQYLADDLAPALVVGDRERLAACSSLGVRPAGLDDVAGQAGADADASGVEPVPADPLRPAAIVYTSGTTSRPKGVMVRHAAYTETGLSFPGWLGLGDDECLWACLPFFHINAQAYSLMSALAHGHRLAISARFHASTFWRESAALGATSVNVVGAMLAILERQPEARWQASPLRTIYAAPAPPPEHRAHLEQRFHVRIAGGYGMSENTFGCAEAATSRTKPGCIGRPRQPASGAFVNELRIVAPGGHQEAAPGEVGELLFRNPVMTTGYWNAPELSRSTLAGGWLHTGDAGRRDEDGDVFLAGRYKEMIRRRGENIAPAEVEDALLEHPSVTAAAVVGVPSELTEDEVVAVIVLAEGASAGVDELRAWAGKRLAPFKVPERIVFREALPMTPTLRVARDVLRREL